MRTDKKFLRYITAILVISLLFTTFGVISVSADGDLESRVVTATLKAKRSITAGGTFTVGVFLDIDEEAADGILSMQFSVSYDPSILTPVEPISPYNDITDESQSYIEYGEIILDGDTSLVAQAGNDGKSVFLKYGDITSQNIFSSGHLATLAFRINPDIAIENSKVTTLEIKNPRFFGREILEYTDDGNVQNSKAYEFTTKTTGCNVSIMPKFSAPGIGSVKVGEKLSIRDYTSLGEDDSLLVEIAGPDGAADVVASAEAEIADGKYKAEFEIGEDYAPGKYKAILSSGNTSATVEFNILAKTEAPPVSDSDTDNNNTGDDNTGDESNTNSGTTTLPGNKPTDTNGGNEDIKDTENKGDNDVVLTPDKPVYPTDIAGHWAEENVKYVYDNGLMTGYEDGTFGAENNITRAEFATVMARLLGLEQNADEAAFDDCEEHWAKGYIGALAKAGIVGGVSDTEFAPDSNITREQMAVILSRAFKLEEALDSMAVFMDDEQISDWAYSDVYKVLNAGYMKGDESGNFAPLANATRAEVATVIYRLHSQM